MDTNKRKHMVMFDESMNEDKLLNLSLQHKSKKEEFTFQKMLLQMNDKEVGDMWKTLYNMLKNKHANVIEDCKSTSPKKMFSKLIPITDATISIGLSMLELAKPIPEEFLLLAYFLNSILFSFPVDTVKNNISYLCEGIYALDYTNYNEYCTSNCIKYLLKRSLISKAAKKDVKRVYALRPLLPKIILIPNVDSDEIWKLLEECSKSDLYTSMIEGQKLITVALTLDKNRVSGIHNSIKATFSKCSKAKAVCYGNAYLEAWLKSCKENNESLRNELEIICILDLIKTAILSKEGSIVKTAQKILKQFDSKRKNVHVVKMLYSLYQPVLSMHLKSPDEHIRTNAAQLFFQAFPLEDPDMCQATYDLELCGQMLLIKDLLEDDCKTVRYHAVIGTCFEMSVQWELFSEDTLKMFFDILIDKLSRDSDSAEVRCAVAQGFKELLENPLTIPTMQNILPKLGHLFHDKISTVRIAFCQLLLSVKKICNIKYYDIVPVEHLLARLEEEEEICLLIVNLIHNSYVPKNEPATWIFRCVELIKINHKASRQFFRHLPRFIGIEAGAKFMVQVIKSIHYYTKSQSNSGKENSQHTCDSLNDSKENSLNTSKKDSIPLQSAIAFYDINIVHRLFEAVAIMWLSCDLAKPENKVHLKFVVANFTKWMDGLVNYYKDTNVWSSVFYLASFMPKDTVPSLTPLCLERLNSDKNKKDNVTLLNVFCNQLKCDILLDVIKDWINLGFNCAHLTTPTPKRLKTGNNSSYVKALEGVKLLDDLITIIPCNKIVFAKYSKELKNFLQLFTNLKKVTEDLSRSCIPTEQVQFITELLLILVKIAVLLEVEENFDGVKFVEDVVSWVENKLCKQVWPANYLNCSSRESILKRRDAKGSFKQLVTGIVEGLCLILIDMSYVGLFSSNKPFFLTFSLELLDLDAESGILLQVSKLLLRHIWSGVFLHRTENDQTALQIVPNCLAKIAAFISNKDFVKNMPIVVLKEIKQNIKDAGKLLANHSGNFYQNSVKSLRSIEKSIKCDE